MRLVPFYLYYEKDKVFQRGEVRSIEGNIPAYVRFVNKTGRPVDLWWRSYEGCRYFRGRIAPNGEAEMDTFITHPWEFLDTITYERYVINNSRVFRPPPCIGNMPFRTNWHITPGVRTLRRLAMIAIGTYMKNENNVEVLGLPEGLVEEVKHAVYFMNKKYKLNLFQEVF